METISNIILAVMVIGGLLWYPQLNEEAQSNCEAFEKKS